MAQRRYSTGKRKAKIRYKNVALLLAVLILIVALICGSCSAIKKNKDNKDDPDVGKTPDSNVMLPPPDDSDEPEINQPLDLTKQTSYRFDSVTRGQGDLGVGDLTLVNNNIKFLGKVNEDDLVVIREKKNGAYWVRDYSVLILPEAMDALNAMLLDFNTATGNGNVMVRSGYRTIEYQQQLYDDELAETGAVSSALVAMPGYSEHHTGLVVDFTTYNGSTYKDFDGSGDYEWIMNNCHKYGFVNRYPKGKEKLTYIDNEPWHFRYVGTPHAKVMKDYDYCLEEYISFIKNYTIDTGFLLVEDDDGSKYIIYYTPLTDPESTSIYIPVKEDETMYDYEISGNNVDGFIVTVKLEQGTAQPEPSAPVDPTSPDENPDAANQPQDNQ